jgi:hypothetical protein
VHAVGILGHGLDCGAEADIDRVVYGSVQNVLDIAAEQDERAGTE